MLEIDIFLQTYPEIESFLTPLMNHSKHWILFSIWLLGKPEGILRYIEPNSPTDHFISHVFYFLKDMVWGQSHSQEEIVQLMKEIESWANSQETVTYMHSTEWWGIWAAFNALSVIGKSLDSKMEYYRFLRMAEVLRLATKVGVPVELMIYRLKELH